MDDSGAGALTSSASAALALIVIVALGSTCWGILIYTKTQQKVLANGGTIN